MTRKGRVAKEVIVNEKWVARDDRLVARDDRLVARVDRLVAREYYHDCAVDCQYRRGWS